MINITFVFDRIQSPNWIVKWAKGTNSGQFEIKKFTKKGIKYAFMKHLKLRVWYEDNKIIFSKPLFSEIRYPNVFVDTKNCESAYVTRFGFGDCIR